MKNILYPIFALCILVLISCNSNDEDDPRLNYPKKVDIDFIITSDLKDKSIPSKIETSISSGTNKNGVTDLDIKTSKHASYLLPFKKIYVQENIKFSTFLNLSYQDHSINKVGDIFKPYTIKLEIKIDGKVESSKEHLIKENNQKVNLGFDFFD